MHGLAVVSQCLLCEPFRVAAGLGLWLCHGRCSAHPLLQPFQGWETFGTVTQGSPESIRGNPGLKDGTPLALKAWALRVAVAKYGKDQNDLKDQMDGEKGKGEHRTFNIEGI